LRNISNQKITSIVPDNSYIYGVLMPTDDPFFN